MKGQRAPGERRQNRNALVTLDNRRKYEENTTKPTFELLWPDAIMKAKRRVQTNANNSGSALAAAAWRDDAATSLVPGLLVGAVLLR